MKGVDKFLNHLDFLARHFPDYDETYIVKIFLLEVGVPVRGSGFHYIQDAVILGYKQPQKHKELYPAIAKEHGIYVKPSQVEGSIHRAIDSAWKNRDEAWESYFPKYRKPTNAEFISRMVSALVLWRDLRDLQKRSERRHEE